MLRFSVFDGIVASNGVISMFRDVPLLAISAAGAASTSASTATAAAQTDTSATSAAAAAAAILWTETETSRVRALSCAELQMYQVPILDEMEANIL